MSTNYLQVLVWIAYIKYYCTHTQCNSLTVEHQNFAIPTAILWVSLMILGLPSTRGKLTVDDSGSSDGKFDFRDTLN